MRTRKTPAATKRTNNRPTASHAQNKADKVFALDIGTRSVIGIVAENEQSELKIIATERQEHKTRSMLDGQIHDVPQVAEIITSVKNKLEKQVGPLKKVAVAAAGRALYTMTAEASMDINGIITEEQEKHLDFITVQAAQEKLAASHIIEDSSFYYCVGYSTVYYMLDGSKIKSLIGQRGKQAVASVIATFLPRQVVDSMQSALTTANLEMQALTLEPIAAINVLIPSTMRHLNLALVDIGAGTSDVAITKDGSVIAYGMVPMAGDEITEAISKQYLLDFNIAEEIKRQLINTADEKIHFTDILGMEYTLSSEEIINSVDKNITDLAEAIAKQIAALNTEAPQAIMLVGGGSLTPNLAAKVAHTLDMPEPRVAVRTPDKVDNISNIPDVLKTPDAVTPLGILKTLATQTLNLISVYINDIEYNMFNFRELTISDALLNAGINLHKYNGKPGLGIMVNINGESNILSGSMGTLAKISLNGNEASLSDKIEENCHICIEKGSDGTTPNVHLADLFLETQNINLYINGEKIAVEQSVLINDSPINDFTTVVHDKDNIIFPAPASIANALKYAHYNINNNIYHYTLNGIDKTYQTSPQIYLNGKTAYLSDIVKENDEIDFTEPKRLPLSSLLNNNNTTSDITVLFNDSPCLVPVTSDNVLLVNDNIVKTDYLVNEADNITYSAGKRKQAIISDVLLAADYTPPKPDSRMTFQILKNNLPVEFTAPVNENDNIKIILTPCE